MGSVLQALASLPRSLSIYVLPQLPPCTECTCHSYLQFVKQLISGGTWNVNDLEDPSEIRNLLSLHTIPMHLYNYMPYNFMVEQIYNIGVSTIAPHCAICTIVAKFDVNKSWYQDLTRVRIPRSSPVLISGINYIGKLLKEEQHIQNHSLPENASHDSNLLTCTTCKVCVHQG